MKIAVISSFTYRKSILFDQKLYRTFEVTHR